MHVVARVIRALHRAVGDHQSLIATDGIGIIKVNLAVMLDGRIGRSSGERNHTPILQHILAA